MRGGVIFSSGKKSALIDGREFRDQETAIPSYRRHRESNLIPLNTTDEHKVILVRYSRSRYQVQMPLLVGDSLRGSALYNLAWVNLCKARPCVISVLCNVGKIIFPAESSFIREVVWARRHNHSVQCGKIHGREDVFKVYSLVSA